MPTLTNENRSKDMKEFGRKLGELRVASGFGDKRAFAAKCGLSYKHYFNIENGVTRPGMLAYIGIIRALGLKNVPLVS